MKFLQGLSKPKPRAKRAGGYDLLGQDARAKKAAKKSKAEAAKKAARPKKPDISYRITPANYLILSEDEKADILRRFVRVIATLDERRRLRISIVHRKAAAECAGRSYDYVEEAVYFTSKQDLGPALSSAGFRSARMDEPMQFLAPEREEASHVAMPDGTLARAFVVHDFSRSIMPAWIHQIAQVAALVEIDIAQLRPTAARRALVTHANTIEAMGGRRRLEEAQDARDVNDRLQRQETRVYECGIRAVVTGKDKKDLAANCKEFARQCAQRSVRAMAVSGKQGEIVLHGWGPRFLFEWASCAAFYPFVSSSMIEVDGAGGVYMGVNEFDGTPVVFDYLRRSNYNLTVLGSSGSGKSVTAKTYLDNFRHMMADKYGEAPVRTYILDLHGEYVALAGHLGMEVVDLMSRDEMGLDPFALLPTSDMAVDMLADVSDMPPVLRSLALSRAEGCRSVREMYDRLMSEGGRDADDCRKAANHLAMFADGDLARMFRGDLKIGDRTVIALRKATESNLNSMLISLALQKIWMDIRDAPAHVPKLLVIEEAWFVLRMPSTAAILSNIARSGRKENCHLIVMTQDIDEVLGSEHGAAVIKNSATVLLHALKPATANTLLSVLDLSEQERDEITVLDKGQAIMRADHNRIKMQVRPTPEQLAKFNTAAQGLVATGADA